MSHFLIRLRLSFLPAIFQDSSNKSDENFKWKLLKSILLVWVSSSLSSGWQVLSVILDKHTSISFDKMWWFWNKEFKMSSFKYLSLLYLSYDILQTFFYGPQIKRFLSIAGQVQPIYCTWILLFQALFKPFFKTFQHSLDNRKFIGKGLNNSLKQIWGKHSYFSPLKRLSKDFFCDKK